MCLLFRYRFLFRYAGAPSCSALSLHDALPIFEGAPGAEAGPFGVQFVRVPYDIEAEIAVAAALDMPTTADRKSTRLNSSHVAIPYTVFCSQKKKRLNRNHEHRLAALQVPGYCA